LMVLFTHLHCKGMFLNNLVHLYRFPVGYTYTLIVEADDPVGGEGGLFIKWKLYAVFRARSSMIF
jgi:hypothetical protein